MGRIRKLISSASREKGIVPLFSHLYFIFLFFFLSRLGFATDDSPCIKPFVFTPPTSYPIDQRLVTEDYQTNIFFHDVALDNVPREIILESYMHGGGSRSGRGQARNANAYLYMRDIAPRASQGKAINSFGEKVDVFHWRAKFGQTSDEAIQRMQEESRAVLLSLGFKTVFVRIPENTLMWTASPHCTTGQIALF